MPARVYVAKASPTGVAEALEWLGGERLIMPGARVFLKPNLTWKAPMGGSPLLPPSSSGS